MFDKTMGRIFGYRTPKIPLNLKPLPITDLDSPSQLRFSLAQGKNRVLVPQVDMGDEIRPGQVLAQHDSGRILVSPVAGKVVSIQPGADLRGAGHRDAILVAPVDGGSTAVYPALTVADGSQARARLQEAGLVTNALYPRPLHEVLWPDDMGPVETLVILVADREPQVCASLQLFRERRDDAPQAAVMLGRVAGARRVMLAVPESLSGEAAQACLQEKVEILSLPAEYPHSLDALVAARAGEGTRTRVVTLETALAVLDTLRDGKVQDKKVITVINGDGTATANYRVTLGTPLRDLLAAAKIEVKEGDKIVAGGPMRGFAQCTLDVGLDAGVDAVTLIRAADVIPWSDEPCVNCGGCVDACPVNLQVQLIGRYAEFDLFGPTEELGIAHCVECGLCAAVCTARRPLVALIRLAKDELEKARVEEEARAKEARAAEALQEGGPAEGASQETAQEPAQAQAPEPEPEPEQDKDKDKDKDESS